MTPIAHDMPNGVWTFELDGDSFVVIILSGRLFGWVTWRRSWFMQPGRERRTRPDGWAA